MALIFKLLVACFIDKNTYSLCLLAYPFLLCTSSHTHTYIYTHLAYKHMHPSLLQSNPRVRTLWFAVCGGPFGVNAKTVRNGCWASVHVAVINAGCEHYSKCCMDALSFGNLDQEQVCGDCSTHAVYIYIYIYIYTKVLTTLKVFLVSYLIRIA